MRHTGHTQSVVPRSKLQLICTVGSCKTAVSRLRETSYHYRNAETCLSHEPGRGWLPIMVFKLVFCQVPCCNSMMLFIHANVAAAIQVTCRPIDLKLRCISFRRSDPSYFSRWVLSLASVVGMRLLLAISSLAR